MWKLSRIDDVVDSARPQCPPDRNITVVKIGVKSSQQNSHLFMARARQRNLGGGERCSHYRLTSRPIDQPPRCRKGLPCLPWLFHRGVPAAIKKAGHSRHSREQSEIALRRIRIRRFSTRSLES